MLSSVPGKALLLHLSADVKDFGAGLALIFLDHISNSPRVTQENVIKCCGEPFCLEEFGTDFY